MSGEKETAASDWTDDTYAEYAQAAADRALEEMRLAAFIRRPRKNLLDFQRDLTGANVLIGRRWGVKGTVVMIVSSTGTGKSVVQTQMAVSFAAGLPCCGLKPRRPFRSWIIQSEDDEDRVAIDRDDILNGIQDERADFDPYAAAKGVDFVDFTAHTGAKFLDALEAELTLTPREERPECVFINPMNAYFGGSLKDGADCSAFFKGGVLRGEHTDGLEAIAKRFGILVIIFGHTPKPPTPKELADWTNDPNICYKMCGASEIADAVRSIIVFLRVPDEDNMFVFNAGKNGYSLDWHDATGAAVTKSYWRWAANDTHFWEVVPPDEWPTDGGAADGGKKDGKGGAADEDVAVVLAHMAAPGLVLEDVDKQAKGWGLSRRRAREAFFQIVRNRDEYHVTSTPDHRNGAGRPTIRYVRIDFHDAEAESDAALETAFTDPVI